MLTARGFRPVARLKPRTAREIGTSPWSIGVETLDRDYIDFSHVRPHLPELGATACRLQAGWAKCEPAGDGQYRWRWLDEIVDGCIAEGLRPWLQVSYGNPRYAGGGGIGLAQGGPTSPEALAAWDRWVAALVGRYCDRVSTWEVWNEPDLHKAFTPETYAEFFIRTATLIRRHAPTGRIAGLCLAGHTDFGGAFLHRLAETGHARLIDEVIFHFYPHNPDDGFNGVENLAAHVRRYAPHASLRQGETGAPSETRKFMALGDFEWNERKQAAWNLRRLLAHHVRGIPMNLFCISDQQYTIAGGAKFDGRNSKGQLAARTDKSIEYRKPAYTAAQSVFTLLDDTFPLQPLRNLMADHEVRTAAYAWQRSEDAAPTLVGFWRADAPPGLAPLPLDTRALPAFPMCDPILIDLMSGTVLEPPTTGTALWANLPLTDSPVAMAERNLLRLQRMGDR